MEYSVIPESQTEDVIKLDERSNVDRAGVWMFEISREEIPVNQSIKSVCACSDLLANYLRLIATYNCYGSYFPSIYVYHDHFTTFLVV